MIGAENGEVGCVWEGGSVHLPIVLRRGTTRAGEVNRALQCAAVRSRESVGAAVCGRAGVEIELGAISDCDRGVIRGAARG